MLVKRIFVENHDNKHIVVIAKLTRSSEGDFVKIYERTYTTYYKSADALAHTPINKKKDAVVSMYSVSPKHDYSEYDKFVVKKIYGSVSLNSRSTDKFSIDLTVPIQAATYDSCVAKILDHHIQSKHYKFIRNL